VTTQPLWVSVCVGKVSITGVRSPSLGCSGVASNVQPLRRVGHMVPMRAVPRHAGNPASSFTESRYKVYLYPMAFADSVVSVGVSDTGLMPGKSIEADMVAVCGSSVAKTLSLSWVYWPGHRLLTPRSG
jgi:hypothetical protein